MMFPKRRERVRSGIERAPQREFPGHRAWVRGHACSVAGCESRQIEAAHVQASPEVPVSERSAGKIKAHDKWTYPLCHDHHREAHDIGHERFDKRHVINRVEIARRLQSVSPHRFKWLTP